MQWRAFLAIVWLCAAAPATSAEDKPNPALEAARAFGARPAVHDISLSPDGQHFAVLVVGAHQSVNLAVVSTEDPTKSMFILHSTGEPEQLTKCDWANDTRLICSIYTRTGKGVGAIGFTRLVAINSDGSGLKLASGRTSDDAIELTQNGGSVIDWYGDAQGSAVLMTRQFAELGGVSAGTSRPGLAVERVDPVTLKRTVVETPNSQAREYITDGLGSVRIMGIALEDSDGYFKGTTRYVYRQRGSRNWQPMGLLVNNGNFSEGFDPWAIDPILDVAYS
ncbi:MAG: hypothetical protein WC816_15795 [Sphingomonas sp.]|jgi:hypothetical protein